MNRIMIYPLEEQLMLDVLKINAGTQTEMV